MVNFPESMLSTECYRDVPSFTMEQLFNIFIFMAFKKMIVHTE